MQYKNPLPTVDECVDWILRSGCSIRFFTVRNNNDWSNKLYCCLIECGIGNRVKSYKIKESTIATCLYEIRKNHKKIFEELSCPPWTKQTAEAAKAFPDLLEE